MKTLSSSAQTLFSQIFSLVWIAGFGLLAILPWLSHAEAGTPAPAGMKLMFLGIWIGGTLMAYFFALRLKRVRLSGRSLLISNYFNEIQISAEEIAEVTENKWMNNQISIHFRRSTPFGKKITFMPKFRWSGNWLPRTIAEELRGIAAGGN